MDVEDSASRLLVQSLQALRMKDIEGENVRTVVSYLKGALLLLKNCADIPTDTHGLLSDIMTSASNDEFCGYTKSIYYKQKRSRSTFYFVNYLKTAKSEYRTLYCAGKWTVSSHNTTVAGFYGNGNEGNREYYHGGRGRRHNTGG